MNGELVSAKAQARFVVTMPPEPSRISAELQKLARSSFTSLTNTHDAFSYLAQRAKERLVVMTPFIDFSGADWATGLFKASSALRKDLILRDLAQLESCGAQGAWLRKNIQNLWEYSFEDVSDDGTPKLETFHAKIVLADGIAAYVGSANFLYRSREHNLECGFLLEGEAVMPVTIMIDAVLNILLRDRDEQMSGD